jgi:hypothetical protein
MHVEGSSLSRGDFLESTNPWDALLVEEKRRAWIERTPATGEGAYNGLSGFHVLLINGKNNRGMKDRHWRPAVGSSRNRRYSILIAIDGGQPGTAGAPA